MSCIVSSRSIHTIVYPAMLASLFLIAAAAAAAYDNTYFLMYVYYIYVCIAIRTYIYIYIYIICTTYVKNKVMLHFHMLIQILMNVLMTMVAATIRV